MAKTHRTRDLIAWMKDWMRDNDLSANDVAAGAGYSSNAPVSMVLRGERSIPMDRLDDWAKGLKIINDEDRAHFDTIARLSVSPVEVREMLWSLHDRLKALEASRETSRQHLAAEMRNLRDRQGRNPKS